MDMRIGIVGHAEDKFTPQTKKKDCEIIHSLLSPSDRIVVSGGCHLGGIDIWAEEIAKELNRPQQIYRPTSLTWSAPGGFKERNQLIANNSDELHVIVAKTYPPDHKGMKFSYCYHCHNSTHIKSGGCWTGWEAKKRGIPVYWHIIVD
jgi:hypothetical protein